MRSLADKNDVAYIAERYGRYGEPLQVIPCPIQINGKINPHVTRFNYGGGKCISVFHIKPIYYEHVSGAWRPMYEVCEWHGNRKVVFKYEKLLDIHPRFIVWLKKRVELLNGELLVTSPFSENKAKLGSIIQEVHTNITKPRIGLTTTTVYPDPDPETTTCDGIAWEETSTSSWATMRNAAGDTGYANVGVAGLRLCAYWADGSNYRQNARSFTLFDTSSITDTDTIDATVLSVYCYDKSDPAGKAPNSDIFTATPASNTNIVAGDYAQTGTTSQTGSAVTYASMTASTYADYTFDATGRGNVSKTGVSKFAVKNSNYDNANSAPGTTSNDAYARANGAETSGTTSDPKLVVTHTVGGTAYTKSTSDTATVTESVRRATARELNETGTITETLRKGTAREFNETNTITDTVTKLRVVLKSIVESITITDSVRRAITKTLEEVATITESVRKAVARELNEVVTITVSATAQAATYVKALTESITITASIRRAVGKAIEETVTITEYFLLRLNGVNAFWTDIYTDTADAWSDIYTDTADAWTDIYHHNN